MSNKQAEKQIEEAAKPNAFSFLQKKIGENLWRFPQGYSQSTIFALMEEFSALSSKGEEAEPKQEWVSVLDRLPEEGGRYLCVVEEQNDLGKSAFVWNCSYSERHGFMDNLQEVTVTHWMPLPEAPKQ